VARASKPKKVTVHGNVRWQVRWRDDAGRQQKRNFETAREANAFEAKTNGELQSGTYVDPGVGRMTLRDFAEAWRAAKPHRSKTAIRVRGELHNHVYPVFGDRAIASIRPSEVQSFIGALSTRLGPGTVRNVIRTLSSIFSAAVLDGVRPNNPCARGAISLPSVDEEQMVPLTREQVDAIANELPHQYRAMVTVLAGTGLRQGELFGLQVRDLDMLRRALRVQRQMQPEGLGPPKGKKSYRRVPFGKVVAEVLAAHLAAHPAKGEEHVFRGADNLPLHVRRIRRTWEGACRRAGLPGVGMHDLRHFYASVLIAAGRSVKEVSERLGHASPAMTLNVYTHLWPKDDDGTRDAIDNALQDHAPRMRPESGSPRRLRRSDTA
jgi:integrase